MSIRFRAFSPSSIIRGTGIAATALILAAAPISALAQNATPAPQDQAAAPAAPAPDAVVATVGGQPITEADLSFAAEDLASELQKMSPEQRRPFLVSVMIDMKLMAEAARAANLDQTDTFKLRKNYLEDRALRRAYFEEKIASTVTDQSVQAAYDKMVADFKPQDQIRASHILVKTEDEAKAIEADLAAGKKFEDLAKEKSIDPGAKNGGDLGYFTRGQMVKPFEDAAFALDVGQVSQPIQTQFGWHVIKLVDRKKTMPPTLDQVRAQLQQQILYTAFDQVVGSLKSKAEVKIPDANLAAAVAKEQTPSN